jgi:hypothetical protein
MKILKRYLKDEGYLYLEKGGKELKKDDNFRASIILIFPSKIHLR